MLRNSLALAHAFLKTFIPSFIINFILAFIATAVANCGYRLTVRYDGWPEWPG